MYCNTQRFEVGDVAKVQITFDSKGKRRAEAQPPALVRFST